MKKSMPARWLILALCSLLLVDCAILLDIPFLRPFLAFVYFSFVPGFLVLNALKLTRLEASKRFVLSVGLSIAFIVVVGLVVNFLALIVGIMTPLSTQMLVGGYSAALVALMLFDWRNAVDIDFDFGNKTVSQLKSALGQLWPFGVIAATFPMLTLLAIRVLNTMQVNYVVLVLLAMVPVYVILMWSSKRRVSTTTYSLATGMLSLAMVLALPLRGIIAGGDFDAEFLAVQEMIHGGLWTFSLSDPSYSSLTATYLTAIYHFLLGTNALETFQFVCPILLCILPVTIFLIAKRYVSSFSAFLCALLFTFQVVFLEAAVTSIRSRMGLLFLALILLVVFDAEIEGQKRQALFLVFSSCLVVSYYTYSYLYVFLCLCVVIALAMPLNRLSHEFRLQRIFSPSILILSAALVYLWWGIATQGTASNFVVAIHNSINSLTQIASVEARTATDQKIYAIGLQGPAEVLNLIAYYATAGLAVLGVVLATVRPKAAKFELEYRLLMIGCLILWVFVIAMPGLSHLVSSASVFAMTLVVLLPAIPLSAAALAGIPPLVRTVFTPCGLTNLPGQAIHSIHVFSRRNHHAYAILVVLLILTIVANTGLSYQLFGSAQAVILNSQGQQYDTWYIHPQELAAGMWLFTNGEANVTIYADAYGLLRLSIASELLPATLQGHPQSLVVQVRTWGGTTPGYSFLRYQNVVDGTAMLSGESSTIASQLLTPVASTTLISGDKIYSNGGSDVYYTSGST
jgi:uncharacterized membrane protein